MADNKKQKVTQYDKLAAVTTIVADTGEVAQIKKFQPTDATTNPSLIFKASSLPEHQDLVNDAIAYGKALEGMFRVLCFGEETQSIGSNRGEQAQLDRRRRN